jgi:putative photosynthetic complex assembly protein 2
MSEIGAPVLLAILLWWLSTGVILYLDGLGRGSFRWSMAGASVLSLAALAALAATSGWETPAGAYVAFLAALMLWGWNEMAFLMGYLAGPRREPCPEGATGFHRFKLAAATLINHELGIVATGALIALLTWDQPNQFGLWTFAILWVMRLSTKINIFLGAPNIPDEFLPPHLRYLASYFRRRPMNGFFPFAITAATLFTALLVHLAMQSTSSPLERTGYALLTTLMALAVLEHWLLYVPVSATKLWAWGLSSHRKASEAAEARAEAGGRPFTPATSWSAELSGCCDPGELKRVLADVSMGSFGQVERLIGAARIGDGWLRFEVAHGQASLDRIAILDTRQARVTATGRAFDGERLKAAFAACAA